MVEPGAPRVAVVGLGRMGAPIARRLAEAFATVAFDLEASRAEGLTSVPSVADAARDADVLVTVLPGPSEVRDVLLEALGALAPGSLWLDLSSNDPRVADELVRLATERGVVSAAAPMGGGPREAAAGELRFFVAAPTEVLPRVQAVLAPLGRPFEPLAGIRPAQAHLVKLLANGLWFGQVVAVTEALLLAGSEGIDAATARALLASSAGGSVFLDRHASALIAGDDMTDFGLHRVVEELDALVRAAEAAGTPHALTELVAALHRQALDEFGPVDGELLAARLLEGRAGRSIE